MSDQTTTLTEAEPVDDAPYGQLMFIVFSTAVVLVSLAVALLSVSGTWWMLGVVCGIHLTATVIVSVVIARALSGRTSVRVSQEVPAEAGSVADLPGAGSVLATV